MKRIAIYIDGSNFYFSLKKKFTTKIDVEKFCKKLAGENDLVKINYYIASVDSERNPKLFAIQQRFIAKLRSIKNLNIVFGRLEKRKQDGNVYFVEKATDVNLALDLVLDAQANLYDEAFIVSNDGDFSGAVKAAVERFEKKIIYVAIGNSKMISYHLKTVATKTILINSGFVEEVKL
ncbi:MAG: NYN domain-containing protein [Nanoarchaeota archaeon]|nr:NYN domain-containing protein [Nanoarchaeota archaeon]